MKPRRVVITGLGVVAPNGIGKNEFWNNLVAGKSGITSSDSADFPCPVIGRVRDFDPSVHIGPEHRRSAKRMSRISQFAVACAEMALKDSQIDLATVDARRVGLCFGTTNGNPYFDQSLDWAEFPPHAVASNVAKQLGITGPLFTCSVGCCTGLVAIEWAATQVATNAVDVVLAGAGDSLLAPLVLAELNEGELLTDEADPAKACRPYDLHRDGLVPSEATAVVTLESLEHAVERDAPIYAEYLACSSATDKSALNRRSADLSGLAFAISSALQKSGLAPGQIDCINSHGLSHQLFDRIETQGLKLGLGATAYHIPVTSIKSMTGASFCGDGLLQVVSSCMMLENGIIPPTINLKTPDPDCDLDFVVSKPRVARLNRLLTNTRAIGGINTVMILAREHS